MIIPWVKQGGMKRGQGRLLPAVLAGSAAEYAAYLADQRTTRPKTSRLIEKSAHLRRHVAEARRGCRI
jgi:hypothetical protein